MNKPAKITVTYDIQVGPYNLKLDEEEAESLYAQLQLLLKKEKLDNLKNAPFDPNRRIGPAWPVPSVPNYPSYPQVWCGQPSSTCDS